MKTVLGTTSLMTFQTIFLGDLSDNKACSWRSRLAMLPVCPEVEWQPVCQVHNPTGVSSKNHSQPWCFCPLAKGPLDLWYQTLPLLHLKRGLAPVPQFQPNTNVIQCCPNMMKGCYPEWIPHFHQSRGVPAPVWLECWELQFSIVFQAPLPSNVHLEIRDIISVKLGIPLESFRTLRSWQLSFPTLAQPGCLESCVAEGLQVRRTKDPRANAVWRPSQLGTPNDCGEASWRDPCTG